ncbi:MAG TPA: Lrp/AsnC family transcriptional regulator [Nitrososphaeraceae archaeon]|nr:Lrp/AsnC family transcriptional regulator [Nitrososphaeraceae archaeon]
MNNTSLDEIDIKILTKLVSDARLSYRSIAEQIGVSPPTVLARVEKLERNKIIKSYSALLDHEKLGYDLTAIIEVTAIKNKVGEVEKVLSKYENVCAIYDITGLTDMIIVAKFRNRKELSNFVKKELSIPSVQRTNTHLVFITVKENFKLL